MAIEDQRSSPAAGGTVRPETATEDIISVNDRRRPTGSRATPFLMLGGICLVILIFGVLTLNIVRAKLKGPKPVRETASSSTTLARSFSTESAPPLPGQSAAYAQGAPQPACSDGSSGAELKGTDGVVVRNAAGQTVKVCPNGQVLGVAVAQEAAAQPIPVRPNGSGAMQMQRYSAAAASGNALPLGTDGTMMLNGGRYGSAPIVPDLNATLQQVAAQTQPKGEGLLTAPPAGSLEAELIPSKTPLVQAARIADVNMLLPKGRTIDCGMSMRIVSSLAGQASCVVTQNVYSANGRVLLIERGSEAVGEYRSGASIGQKRLFVLWNRIITPGGVVINLQSPGADELGSTGLTGKVDSHWFERIGSAFLLSTIQDAIQYEVAEQQAKSGGTTLVLGNTAQAGDQMAQRVLESTINIPPTIYKNQGDRAVIYVARDLDFSSVYKLRSR